MKKDISSSSAVCAALFTSLLVSAPAYSAVSSEDDSVNNWGPWTTIATAAGGKTAIRLNLKFTNPQNFTDTGQFVTDVPADSDSLPILFGALGDYSADGKQRRRVASPGRIFGPEVYRDNNRVMASLSSTIQFSDIDQNPEQYEPEFEPGFEQDGPGINLAGTGSFTATDEYQNSFSSDQLIFRQITTPLGEMLRGGSEEGLDKALFLNSAISGLNVGIITAVNGDTVTKGTFIGGTASSLNSVQALARNTYAHYEGRFMRNLNNSRVSIDIDFSNASWGGYFSSGNVDFGVQGGTISGANLTASNERFSPNVSQGSISASFFGGNAEAIAGIVDVEVSANNFPGPQTESINPPPIEIPETKRFVDTFVTLQTDVGNGDR